MINLSFKQLRQAADLKEKIAALETELTSVLSASGDGRPWPFNAPVSQAQVFDVVQDTLDNIAKALANGNKVELRNFGVFEALIRKARIGRNPKKPQRVVHIPTRTMVKFKAGKDMRAEVLKLPASVAK